MAFCHTCAYPPELFFSLPNVDTSLPRLVDENHLRGIFRVVDIDRFGEFDAYPFSGFADHQDRVAGVEVVGTRQRKIEGRSRPRRRTVAAFANIPLHLKTAKRNRFVALPVMPNAFKCTEGSGTLGEVCLSAVASASASVARPFLFS